MMYKVLIDKVENGFLVKAGCKVFVFQTYKQLEKELKKYLEDPEGYIKRHKYAQQGQPTGTWTYTTPLYPTPESVTVSADSEVDTTTNSIDLSTDGTSR